MAEWNKNNLAHTNTFLALRILVQTNKTFAASGSQSIKELSFWVVGESSTLRAARARGLAAQLHNVFTMVFRSELESGATKAGGIKAMANVLVEGDKTVCDLADTADVQYDFSMMEVT